MTDRTPGRIDLRAIERADSAQADRVIAAAMARIAASPGQQSRDVVVEWAERFTRPALIAAAVLAAVAVGTLALTDGRREPAPQVATLATWVESEHVPTNGELLLTFQGYGR